MKLSAIPAPAVAGCVREKTVKAAIARNGGSNVPRKRMTFLGEGERGIIGTPRDIADTALFLAYQDYITGENIVVDGGRTLGPGRD